MPQRYSLTIGPSHKVFIKQTEPLVDLITREAHLSELQEGRIVKMKICAHVLRFKISYQVFYLLWVLSRFLFPFWLSQEFVYGINKKS